MGWLEPAGRSRRAAPCAVEEARETLNMDFISAQARFRRRNAPENCYAPNECLLILQAKVQLHSLSQSLKRAARAQWARRPAQAAEIRQNCFEL